MGQLSSIDHVLVAVRDIDAATGTYERLLGRRVSLRGAHPAYGSANAIFQLENTYVELIAPAGKGPFADRLASRLETSGEGLFGVAFGTPDAATLAAAWRAAGLAASDPQEGEGHAPDGSVRYWRNVFVPSDDAMGLFFFAIEHRSDPATRPVTVPDGAAEAALHAVDHVVVNTPDADRSIQLFGERMGIRLALDRDAPQWGARMLFFRLGGITLEVVQRYGQAGAARPTDGAGASYWGMAFRTADIDAARRRLSEAGVDVSEVRAGRKPGTRVCTVRNGTCGVPTLLIGLEDGKGA